MTREEAIKRIKERLASMAWCTDDEDKDALATLIPELSESEDEKIRKWLYEYIDAHNWRYDYTVSKEEALAYLEKQKDSDKAMSAIEKIDKYMDLHTANAHDMDDSHPDKKYYIGVDDTLCGIAGILNNTYSEK